MLIKILMIMAIIISLGAVLEKAGFLILNSILVKKDSNRKDVEGGKLLVRWLLISGLSSLFLLCYAILMYIYIKQI